jgi:asparagine synthetase B (glutamine-hydrolysing)
MCGWVFALLQQNSTAGVVDLPSLIEAIRLRGPDSYQYNQQPITDDGTLQLTIAASVLHLRGLNPTTQPFPILPPNCNSALDANGCDRINNNCPDWICWNGQIFSINGRPIDGEDGQIVDDTLSDTRLLAHLLSTHDHESQDCDNGDFARHLCNVLSSIDDGPWAFAYHDTARKRLYFARDRLGRRSLLWTVPNSIDDSSNSSTYPDVTSLINSFGNSFIVCSVSCGPLPADGPLRWAEVPCDGLFCLDYSAKSLRCIPWTVVDSRTFVDGGSNIDGQLITTYPVSLNAAYTTTADYTAEMTRFHRILSESVRRRIINIPGPVVSGTGRLAVLFSGGLDCTILAAICHKYLPPNEPIDLLNVAFENPGSAHYHKKTIDDAAIFMVPDRMTGRRSAQELR